MGYLSPGNIESRKHNPSLRVAPKRHEAISCHIKRDCYMAKCLLAITEKILIESKNPHGQHALRYPIARPVPALARLDHYGQRPRDRGAINFPTMDQRSRTSQLRSTRIQLVSRFPNGW